VAQFVVRPAAADDARAMAEMFAAVAGERDGIATEPPVDIGERAAQFARAIADSVVAVAGGQHVQHPDDRTGQYRRASGELWDSIILGLPL
jgi:hypothetical protein